MKQVIVIKVEDDQGLLLPGFSKLREVAVFLKDLDVCFTSATNSCGMAKGIELLGDFMTTQA